MVIFITNIPLFFLDDVLIPILVSIYFNSARDELLNNSLVSSSGFDLSPKIYCSEMLSFIDLGNLLFIFCLRFLFFFLVIHTSSVLLQGLQNCSYQMTLTAFFQQSGSGNASPSYHWD